ncbi:hypothetical protein ACQ4PT_017345 [Festuca glaucescens]
MRPPQGGRRCRASFSSRPGDRGCNLLPACIPQLRSPSEVREEAPADLLLDEKAQSRGRSSSLPLLEPVVSVVVFPVDEAEPKHHSLELLTCRDCGHCSETFEPFLDLSLEIDQVDDLVAALESLTKVEQINDAKNKLTCGSCNGQVCKDKQLLLDKAPDVVAFQLKRFALLDGSIEKIDKHVAYPSELDLRPFHSNPDKEDLKYDRYGVVKHSGLPSFGHYMRMILSGCL